MEDEDGDVNMSYESGADIEVVGTVGTVDVEATERSVMIVNEDSHQPPTLEVGHEEVVITDSPETANASDDLQRVAEIIGYTVEVGQAQEAKEETSPVVEENKAGNVSIDDDDGQTCSICLETWTISGEHRLCALKCGHLFGNSCIVRWLRQSPIQMRACPSCKAKASLRDIRFIFARRVIAADTTQEELLKQQLDEFMTKYSRLESELTAERTNVRMYSTKLTELQKEMALLKQRSNQIATHRRITNFKYTMNCNIELCKNNSCRVMEYNRRTNSLYVSVMSTNNLFPGYAMRKISAGTWTQGKLVYLHPKPIRDAAYSTHNDLLMTVGLDKYVKLVQGVNDLIVTTIQSQTPLWSCCWDNDNTNRLWVGGVGGIVCEYDIRQSKTAMSVTNSIDVSPVASLASVSGGFIACRLNTVTAYQKKTDSIHSVQLPIEGIFTCVKSDPTNNDLLVSCRSSSNHPRSRHIYCKSDVENFEFSPLCSFEGSMTLPLMSRTALYSVDEQPYVSAYNGDENGVCTWSVSSGSRLHSLGASDYVVDMLPLTDSAGSLTHLATLSQTRLRIYQMTPSGE